MQAIVIGAGPAGLAAGTCLARAGVGVEILERGPDVGMAWRGHYDRLHLHTSRRRSGLPFHPMPKRFGTFPSRDDVIGYLEGYAAKEGLRIRFGCEVVRVAAGDGDGSGHGGWRVVARDGSGHEAEHVIFATGTNARPRRPDWPGLEGFPGPVAHSSEYRNAAGFEGARVLVVGFGNSGADIALDLAEAGAKVTVSVRGPVNILPLRVLGLPTSSLGLLQAWLGPGPADRLTAPLIRALVGRPADYGLRTPPKGPNRQIVEDARIPMIDVGVLGAIRDGRVAVRPGLERFEGAEAVFADGRRQAVDAVVLATGYDCDLRPLLPDAGAALDARGRPLVSGGPSGVPGLWFCSYRVTPSGQFRQAGVEARAIAELIAAGTGTVRQAG